jgi:hypothetical protein
VGCTYWHRFYQCVAPVGIDFLWNVLKRWI